MSSTNAKTALVVSAHSADFVCAPVARSHCMPGKAMTSKGAYFLAEDLPAAQELRD